MASARMPSGLKALPRGEQCAISKDLQHDLVHVHPEQRIIVCSMTTRLPPALHGAPTVLGALLAHPTQFDTVSSLVKNEIGPGVCTKADFGMPCIGLEPMTR